MNHNLAGCSDEIKGDLHGSKSVFYRLFWINKYGPVLKRKTYGSILGIFSCAKENADKKKIRS